MVGDGTAKKFISVETLNLALHCGTDIGAQSPRVNTAVDGLAVILFSEYAVQANHTVTRSAHFGRLCHFLP